MKSIALLLACFCSASVLAQGRTETLNIEIGRSSAVSLTATEETDTTVNVVVKSGRMDFDLTGWRGILWYGVQGSGLAITNTSTSYNVFTFDLPTSKIPTNGLYELQVFGVTTNRTEEWARGRMSVRLNPSKGSLPPEWSSYPAFYASLTNRLFALESKTNLLNTVYSWGDHAAAGYMFLSSWLSWLGTNTYVKAETDSIALSALANNKPLRLFDPSDVNSHEVNHYMDGAGNKYVVSNSWEMSFSSDFGTQVAFPTAQTNYLFTAWSQQYFEGTVSYYWLGRPVYLTYWSINLTGIYHKPGGFYTRDWLPTTNALVLDPVAETGATGYAFIRLISTTNLLATLASQADVGSLTAGLVSTNETRNVRLNTLTVTNTITAPDGTTVIIPRTRRLTDSASVVAADWENRYLYTSGGRITLDWEGGILTAYHPVDGYSQSIDWINRALLDSGERTVLAWQDRWLGFPTTGAAIDWSVDDVVTINGNLSLSGSLTLGGVTKTEWPAASSGAPAVWTNMVWGAAGTNATYRMYWDSTNGTFAVEEIIP